MCYIKVFFFSHLTFFPKMNQNIIRASLAFKNYLKCEHLHCFFFLFNLMSVAFIMFLFVQATGIKQVTRTHPHHFKFHQFINKKSTMENVEYV